MNIRTYHLLRVRRLMLTVTLTAFFVVAPLQLAHAASNSLGYSTYVQQLKTAVTNGTATVKGTPINTVPEGISITDLTSLTKDQVAAKAAQIQKDALFPDGMSSKSNKSSMSSAGTVSPMSSSMYGETTPSRLDFSNVDKSSHVSGSAGDFEYSYPIQVPEGRNGLTPTLNLAYSNQANSYISPYGFGWSLGIPYIERTSKKGVNAFYTDPTFSSSLSGELATTTTAGKYFAKVDDGSYLTYTFASSTWTAIGKDGTTYFFGSATTSQLLNAASTTQTYRWMLDKVQDSNGYYITYSYTTEGNQIYPSSIQYAFASSTPVYKIDFTLQNASAARTSYEAGFPITNGKNIGTIAVSTNGTTTATYTLTYTKSAKSGIDLLTSILHKGYKNGVPVSMPLTTFTYNETTNGGSWNNSTVFANTIPQDLETDVVDPSGSTNYYYTRTELDDINGDALPDWISGTTAYLNTGSGWSASSTWSLPVAGYDGPNRRADVNGDGLLDIVVASRTIWYPTWNHPDDIYRHVYINNGDGTWTDNPTWAAAIPDDFEDTVIDQNGVGTTYEHTSYLMDMNGDGLVDWLEGGTVRLNTGAGWATTSWSSLPLFGYDGPNRVADVNGDHLPDLVQSSRRIWYPTWNHPDDVYRYVYLNNGDGTWTSSSTLAATIPADAESTVVDQNGVSTTYETYTYLLDIDGDGLSDWGIGGTYYLNTGNGWTSSSTWGGVPSTAYDKSYRLADVNGDGMQDIVQASRRIWDPVWSHADDVYHNVYLNGGKTQWQLTKITNEYGGTTNVVYTHSAQLSGGVLRNPNNPTNLPVVQAVGYADPVSGSVSTTTYMFTNGKNFYSAADIWNRKFAGFGKMIVADIFGSTTTRYHQGDASATSTGEYLDDEWKIGKPYRIDITDTLANTFKSIINKWETVLRVGKAAFVKLTRSTEEDFDGNATHKDKAVEYAYNDAAGTVTQKTDWGQVTAAGDGNFTDVSGDTRITTISYATSTSGIVIQPDDQILTDGSSTKISETKTYYDNLGFGGVSNGNKTNEQGWVSGSTYASTQHAYNSYGLVTQDTDPRGKITTYSYDPYTLFVATTTNPLSQKTSYTYDYAAGKPQSTIDINGLLHQKLYDGLGRLITELEPDLTNASSTVTKNTYAYDFTSGPKVTKTEYLDGSNQHTTITYFDGFARPYQSRGTTETTNTYLTTDTSYDAHGNVAKQSLPYFSTGSARTSAITTSALLSSYTYDVLDRVKSMTNAYGATNYTYGLWVATTTDVLGHVTAQVRNAYGNIAEARELDATLGRTFYTWSGLDKLTSIIDAVGNIRNFIYDGLGRLTLSEDLHAPGDTTFGTTTYAYDLAGNIGTTTRPNGNVITYTYDDLNRMKTEDVPSTPYVDISYGYDNSVHFGKGKLTSVSTASIGSGFDYDANGNLLAEQHIIPGSATTTTWYYYDRQANPTFIVYPDNSQVYYAYNAGGQLESLQELEAGTSTWAILSYNFNYGPNGQVTLEQLGNSTNVANTYDANYLYRLSNKAAYSSTTYLQYLTYGYDGAGKITSINDQSGTATAKNITYTYDSINRLRNASTTSAVMGNYIQAWKYLMNGNIATSTGVAYTYGGNIGTNYANPNAPTAIGTTTLTYDKDGNLLTDGSLTNTWNYRDWLTQTVAHIGTTTSTTTYTYDQSGARISRTVGGTTTYYPNKYYSTSGTTKDKYVYANGQLLALIETLGTTTSTHYAYQDHLGSIAAMATASGTPEESLDYYPYGAQRFDFASSSLHTGRQFLGQFYDPASALDYLNARYLNGTQNQFLSEDPVFLGDPNAQDLAHPQSLNSYSYANGNPIMNSDSSGQSIWTFAKGLTNSIISNIGSFLSRLTKPAYMQNIEFAYGIYSLASDPTQTFDSAKSYVTSTVSALGTVGQSDSGDYLLGSRTATVLPFLIPAIGEESAAASFTVTAPKVESAVVAGSKAALTADSKAALTNYTANNWNDVPLMRPSSIFKNRENYLPEQPYGYYREYDAGMSSSPERFVRGANGELYYTNTHYGDRGYPAFINIPGE